MCEGDGWMKPPRKSKLDLLYAEYKLALSKLEAARDRLQNAKYEGFDRVERAEEKLAEILADAVEPKGRVSPITLGCVVRGKWDTICKLAHIIHDGGAASKGDVPRNWQED